MTSGFAARKDVDVYDRKLRHVHKQKAVHIVCHGCLCMHGPLERETADDVWRQGDINISFKGCDGRMVSASDSQPNQLAH